MLEIIKEPNPILKQISEPVKLPLSKEDKALLDEMYNWLKEHSEEAIGLAAVQFGYLKRMCVIKIKDGGVTHSYKLVNPKIVRHSERYTFIPEGCLSVPEVIDTPVKRWDSVTVIGFDAITNRNVTIVARGGLLTRCLQHEIDHMDGIEFTQRLKKGE